MPSWLSHRALPAVLLLTAGLPACGSGWDDMTVAPRWGTVWLSPRLNANWVNLTYADMLTQRPAPVGEVVLDLPAGVQCLWAFEVKFHQTPLAAGRSELVLDQVPMDGTKGVFLLLAAKLAAGTLDRGSCRARWDGGGTRVKEFAVKVIDVPVARQPRQLMTGVATWPYMIDNWPDFQRQFASFGCNQMDLWHTAIYQADRYQEKPRPPALDYVARIARSNRELGILTAVDASIWWAEGAMSDDPDAHALFVDGTRAGPCPSYRGPGFVKGMQKNAAIAHSGISWIQSDEEIYGNGNFTLACVCPRCEARWREWLKANRPELPYLPPKAVIAERDTHPDHQRAWLWFRAALTTERYRLYRAELARVVGQTKASSSPQPRLGWWAGAAEDHTLYYCMQDARGLAAVIDQIIPQLYFRYGIPPRRFRDLIRRQCWAVGGERTYAGLDSDHTDSNVPGNLAAAVLETLFAGGRGYCMWYGPYMDTRQWAELAAVNDVAARYEETFLKGRDSDLFRCFAPEGEGDYFHPWSNDVFATTREMDRTGLLLISDYRAKRAPLWVERSNRVTGAMQLRDAFTGELAANLQAGQWEFRIELRDSPVRLLTWTKGRR